MIPEKDETVDFIYWPGFHMSISWHCFLGKTYEDVASGYPQKLNLLTEKNESYSDNFLVGFKS